MKLSEHLAEKASQFPECSYGANQVTLKLNNGNEIKNVMLAWGGEIVKIGKNSMKNDSEIPFLANEVVDVISEI